MTATVTWRMPPGGRAATALVAVGLVFGGMAAGVVYCRWASTSGWGHRLPLAKLPEQAAVRAVPGPGTCWALDEARPNSARWLTEVAGLLGRLEILSPTTDGPSPAGIRGAGDATPVASDQAPAMASLRGELQPVDVAETIRITVSARAIPPRTLSVMATQSFGRFEHLGFSASLVLGEEWSTQTLDWVPADYEPNPALHLFAGDEPGAVEFREIRVEAHPDE